MTSPYKAVLKGLEGKMITLDRDGAPSLKGNLIEIDEDGCFINQEVSNPELVVRTFVAFDDLRGVGSEDWNPDAIGH